MLESVDQQLHVGSFEYFKSHKMLRCSTSAIAFFVVLRFQSILRFILPAVL